MTEKRMTSVLRSEKVEFLGTKDGKQRVIATVSQENGKLIVETNDKEFKKNFLELVKRANEGDGRPLRNSRDIDGWHEDFVTFQRSTDSLFLLTLIGPWCGMDQELWDYKHVWAREAGKTWEEEIPEEMLTGESFKERPLVLEDERT